MIEKPVFLVGSERSGTTVLRLMIDHHPEISWLNEFEYSVDAISEQGEFPSINSYHEFLRMNRIFRATGFTINPALNYPELVDSFLEQKRSSANKKIIGATVHRNFDRLISIWSDARFIHIIRDPRDVARSCIGMGWAGNVWYGVDYWIYAEKLWDKLKSNISPQRYMEIHYEDLIREPETTLTSICQFLELDYSPSMLDYDRNTPYNKPNPKLIEQWRQKLSEPEIQLVEAKTGILLEQRGYQLSRLPRLKPSSLMLQQLSLQNRWYKFTFRIKKWGWSLALGEYLSRKFKLNSWHQQNRLKIQEKQQQRLRTNAQTKMARKKSQVTEQ